MRLHLSLLILLFVSGLLPAQYQYVPGNTPTTGQWSSGPFNVAKMKGAITIQYLYEAKYFAGKRWRILDIAFATGFTSFSATNMQITFSHLVGGTLSSILASNLPNPVIVYSGPLAWSPKANTWSAIGLQKGFTYNGSDDLVMEMRWAMATGGGDCRFDPWAIPQNINPGNAQATVRYDSDRNGVKTRFTTTSMTVLASGATRPGSLVALSLQARGQRGLVFQAASSLGEGPIRIGNRNLPLGFDPVLDLTVRNAAPAIFKDYFGVLGSSGFALAKIQLPNEKRLVGIKIYSAFVTFKVGAPHGIQSISPNVCVTVTK